MLGLDPAATPAAIAHAYRSLVRRHHPDTRDGVTGPAADEALARVLAAYAVLGDPGRRRAYDAQRSAAAPPPRPRSDGAPTTRPEHRDAPASRSTPSPWLVIGPVRRHR